MPQMTASTARRCSVRSASWAGAKAGSGLRFWSSATDVPISTPTASRAGAASPARVRDAGSPARDGPGPRPAGRAARATPEDASSAPLGGLELLLGGHQDDLGLLHVDLRLVDGRLVRPLPGRHQFDLGLFD